jgi:hypothetical protein
MKSTFFRPLFKIMIFLFISSRIAIILCILECCILQHRNVAELRNTTSAAAFSLNIIAARRPDGQREWRKNEVFGCCYCRQLHKYLKKIYFCFFEMIRPIV